MNQFVFSNNFQAQLAAPITSATQTVIEVSSTANLPSSIPPGYFWALTLNDAATQTIFEIVYVTGYSGNNLTVLRGQENTTARTWNSNDLAYSCATAGVLASFLSAAQAGDFVELSPATVQTGSINVSGTITSQGKGSFGGVSVGGALTGATSGTFSADVSAYDFASTRPYANTSILSLPLRLLGNATQVGIGPSSGIAYQGITATALAIAAATTGKGIAIDTNGNVGIYGNVGAAAGYFSGLVDAAEFLQAGLEVIDTITSSTLSVVPSGHSVAIDLSGDSLVGASVFVVNAGLRSGTENVSITLPGTNADTYAVAFRWYFTGIGGEISARVFVASGSLSGEYTNGPLNSGSTGVQAGQVICMLGTAVGGQTITFTADISSGSTTSNNPIEILATRIS